MHPKQKVKIDKVELLKKILNIEKELVGSLTKFTKNSKEDLESIKSNLMSGNAGIKELENDVLAFEGENAKAIETLGLDLAEAVGKDEDLALTI